MGFGFEDLGFRVLGLWGVSFSWGCYIWGIRVGDCGCVVQV